MMWYKTIDLEDGLRNFNVVDVAKYLLGDELKKKKSGRGYKALCPVHRERHPSFIVREIPNTFHCFGCGIGGGPFDLVFYSSDDGCVNPINPKDYFTEKFGIDFSDPTQLKVFRRRFLVECGYIIDISSDRFDGVSRPDFLYTDDPPESISDENRDNLRLTFRSYGEKVNYEIEKLLGGGLFRLSEI